MDECWRYQRLILCIVIGVAVVGAVALLACMPGQWQYALGLVWGAAGGLVSYRMSVLAIYRFLQNPEKATPPATGFRWFLVAGITLAIAIAVNKLTGMAVASPYTVAAGVFLPNLALIADGFLRRPAPGSEEAANKENAGEK